MKKETIKGYKVFNPDWTCKDFKYEVGKKYKIKATPVCCSIGFHFCEIASDCFSYYSFDLNNHVAYVEALGDIDKSSEDSKVSTNHIHIIEEISWEKLLTIVNTGKSNSGYRNSGNWNSGYSNSGNRNSGNWNSGDSNSGNWNSGNSNSGYFNTTSSLVRIFDIDTKLTFEEVSSTQWFKILNSKNFHINKWIDFNNMTDEEKIKYSKAFVCNGYLKSQTYKEAWREMWNTLTIEEIVCITTTIPNFNKTKFEIITGISL